jgi:hypothetical protein
MLLTARRGPIEQRRGRYEMKIRSAEIDRGLLKSLKMAGVGMPQSSR